MNKFITGLAVSLLMVSPVFAAVTVVPVTPPVVAVPIDCKTTIDSVMSDSSQYGYKVVTTLPFTVADGTAVTLLVLTADNTDYLVGAFDAKNGCWLDKYPLLHLTYEELNKVFGVIIASE